MEHRFLIKQQAQCRFKVLPLKCKHTSRWAEKFICCTCKYTNQGLDLNGSVASWVVEKYNVNDWNSYGQYTKESQKLNLWRWHVYWSLCPPLAGPLAAHWPETSRFGSMCLHQICSFNMEFGDRLSLIHIPQKTTSMAAGNQRWKTPSNF